MRPAGASPELSRKPAIQRPTDHESEWLLSCALNWVFFAVNLSFRFPITVSTKTRTSSARDVLTNGKSLARRALFRAHRRGCFAAHKQRWNRRGALCYRTGGAPSQALRRGLADAATRKISCFPLSWSVPSLYPRRRGPLQPRRRSKAAPGMFLINCRRAGPTDTSRPARYSITRLLRGFAGDSVGRRRGTAQRSAALALTAACIEGRPRPCPIPAGTPPLRYFASPDRCPDGSARAGLPRFGARSASVSSPLSVKRRGRFYRSQRA